MKYQSFPKVRRKNEIWVKKLLRKDRLVLNKVSLVFLCGKKFKHKGTQRFSQRRAKNNTKGNQKY